MPPPHVRPPSTHYRQVKQCSFRAVLILLLLGLRLMVEHAIISFGRKLIILGLKERGKVSPRSSVILAAIPLFIEYLGLAPLLRPAFIIRPSVALPCTAPAMLQLVPQP